MLILMKSEATRDDILHVKDKIGSLGFTAHEIPGVQRVAIGITGNNGRLEPDLFTTMSGVADAVPVSKPYKLVSREAKSETTQVICGDVRIGGTELAVIAGPCSVESREQVLVTARAVKQAGAKFLRGGAFKPRSSPYSFQGMKEEGLILLREARAETGLKIVTEVKDVLTLSAVAEVADHLMRQNLVGVAVVQRHRFHAMVVLEIGEVERDRVLHQIAGVVIQRHAVGGIEISGHALVGSAITVDQRGRECDPGHEIPG